MNIKYNDLKTINKLDIEFISNKILKIITQESPNLSGFQIFTENDDLLGDYSDFTTLYKSEDDGYMLSNDGSVYKELDIPKHIPTLNEIKEQKISEISQQCRQTIYKGIDVIFADRTEHFSLTIEDQLNLLNRKNQIRDGKEKIEYHADGEMFKYYTAEEMEEIIETSDNFIIYNTSYCNSLMSWIKELDNIEQIQSIKYGDFVPKNQQSEPLKALLRI